MPTRNPRVNVVLEKPLYERVQKLAKKEHISLSLKIRDLVREALDTQEDEELERFAEESAHLSTGSGPDASGNLE
ncbi:MAG: ribbon-helix-helix domain-containing protein [Desulfurellaceae bacterium]|nr:ribbon-helix-helix domain-containing protein [Desulfurellaceae bacterium]